VIFASNTATWPFRSDPALDALEVWRTAARLVSDRWELFAIAGAGEREAAFRAYVAALDAEEAASDRLRRLAMPKVA
jgi:hypothetical protein